MRALRAAAARRHRARDKQSHVLYTRHTTSAASPTAPVAAPALGSLLQSRYPASAAPAGVATEREVPAALETLLSHRSVRAFRDAALPEGTLEWLVAAAQSAPTAAQRPTVAPWSQVSSERVAGPDALRGRHRLREALEGLFFPLR
jgi:hypothetical protein